MILFLMSESWWAYFNDSNASMFFIKLLVIKVQIITCFTSRQIWETQQLIVMAVGLSRLQAATEKMAIENLKKNPYKTLCPLRISHLTVLNMQKFGERDDRVEKFLIFNLELFLINNSFSPKVKSKLILSFAKPYRASVKISNRLCSSRLMIL